MGWAVTIPNADGTLSPVSGATVYLDFFDGPNFIRRTSAYFRPRRLSPGNTAAEVGLERNVAQATRMEISIKARDWGELPRDVGWHVAGLQSVRLDDGRYETTGRFTSNGNALGIPGLQIHVVYRDADGHLLGGDELVTNHCSCGKTDFTIVSSMPLPPGTTSEAYWSLPLTGWY